MNVEVPPNAVNKRLVFRIARTWVPDNEGPSVSLGEAPEQSENICTSRAALFNDLREEYGACISSVRMSYRSGDIRTGWVFRQRDPDDDGGAYETWVTLAIREEATWYGPQGVEEHWSRTTPVNLDKRKPW